MIGYIKFDLSIKMSKNNRGTIISAWMIIWRVSFYSPQCRQREARIVGLAEFKLEKYWTIKNYNSNWALHVQSMKMLISSRNSCQNWQHYSAGQYYGKKNWITEFGYHPRMILCTSIYSPQWILGILSSFWLLRQSCKTIIQPSAIKIQQEYPWSKSMAINGFSQCLFL